MRYKHVEQRVDGYVVALGDPVGELAQERGVSKGLLRCRLRPPPRLDPLLDEPLPVSVDAGLEGVRRVPEQR